jgi:hypothetical protein
MQEYGVLFLKGLLKGLRPFRAGPLDEPMLYECWNLMPTETGLVGHDALVPIGIPSVGFDYLGIYDQNQTLWFWSPWYDGGIEIWDRIPTHEYYKINNVTPTVTPWWWPLEDELGGLWYLYPSITTGQPTLSNAQPTNGSSTLTPEFAYRSIYFEYWQYRVNSTVYSWYPSFYIPVNPIHLTF